MQTCKAAIYHAKDNPFELVDILIPGLGEGQVLVRVEYTTLCRSDLNTFSGKRREKTPTILGHEIVGRIELFGPGAARSDIRGTNLEIGDRITWAIYAAAPDSYYARKGIPQKGPDLFKYGHERIHADSTLHGGLAEYCILRKHTPIIKLLQPVPLPAAALINCSAATVSGALRLTGSVRDETVLIAGAGMLGVIACSMCRVQGAKTVIALDINDHRLQTAKAFGADVVIHISEDALSLRRPLDQIDPELRINRVLDFTGSPATMEQTLDILDTGGVAVWIGATFPQRDLHINAEALIRNVHTIYGLHNYNDADLISAVSFMENHHIDFPFGQLIDNRFTLERIHEAFRYGLETNPYRVGIQITNHDQ